MVQIEELLALVEKPARYIGNEWNAVKKDISSDLTRVALIYPDLYEIGMSHVGSRILYELINERDNMVCERAFAPAIDMERLLLKHNVPLFSLESRLPLGEFHVLGFTLQYELTYTNILTILNLAGIPFFAKDRLNHHPLIIAGGPCAFNPEPMAPFFDCFVLGEGEEVMLELLEVVNKWRKEQSGNRKELLENLAKIKGIYVPLFYNISYNSDGTVKEICPNQDGIPPTVVKRVIKDLNQFPYPKRLIVPYTDVIHNRMTLELFRGCTRGCRFCQSGILYRPVRERSPEILREILKEQSQNSGYEEVTLSSLSSADYTGIEEFVESITGFCRNKNINVSLPSTRVDNFPFGLAQKLQALRRAGLTLAPEAGSERLRKFINKNVSGEDLLNAINNAVSFGWNTIKLYFMIGLPTEEMRDLEEMCQLIKDALHVGKRCSKGGRIEFHISISSFVPKAHTPFQWSAQDPAELLEKKHRFLADNLPKRNVRVSWHNTLQSHLEGVLSRGDRRIAEVVLRAWELGSRLDEWSETFQYLKWEAAFRDCNIDPSFYANRERSLEEVLPWGHISTGVTKEWLKKEHEDAYKLQGLRDCHLEPCCYDCGVCGTVKAKVRKAKPGSIPIENIKLLQQRDSFKYIVTFSKGEEVKFISHLDLMRTFDRSMRRAGLALAMTGGFHQRPKVSIAAPLAIGIASEVELMEIELLENLQSEELLARINKVLPQGLMWLKVKTVPSKTPSLMSLVQSADYNVEAVIKYNGTVDWDEKKLNLHILNILDSEELLLPAWKRGGKTANMDGFKTPVNELGNPGGITDSGAAAFLKHDITEKNVRHLIGDIVCKEIREQGKALFSFKLVTGSRGGIKPQDTLKIMESNGWTFTFCSAHRVAIYLREEGLSCSGVEKEAIQLRS